MSAETTKDKYKIAKQGAKVTENSENKRIKTVKDAKSAVSLQKAHVPLEDSENKRITKAT